MGGLTELVTANATIFATLTKSITIDAEHVAGLTELERTHEEIVDELTENVKANANNKRVDGLIGFVTANCKIAAAPRWIHNTWRGKRC